MIYFNRYGKEHYEKLTENTGFGSFLEETQISNLNQALVWLLLRDDEIELGGACHGCTEKSFTMAWMKNGEPTGDRKSVV